MKYVVEIRKQGDLIEMWTDAGTFKHYITGVSPNVFDHMQKLDDDYINQNFGYMQDESFCTGFELARRISANPCFYDKAITNEELETIFGTSDTAEIMKGNPLEVEEKVEAYEAEQARVKAEKAKEAAKAKEAQREALDKAAAKAVEVFRKLGANYVQIAQAVTKAMAEAVEAES